MAKMVLGKTPQELEAEKAKRAREQEAEIQQSIMERQKKIQALHSKQKTNKIIIGLSIFAIAAVFVTFGTYNTFFKKGLTIEEVNNQIAAYTQQSRFPSEGLDNYVRDNCEELFNKYMSLDNKRARNIASVDVDENSCYIFKVRKLNATLAEVYFSVDVIVTEKDKIVTDPVIIEQLKRNGFGINSTSNSSGNQVTQTTEQNNNQTVVTLENNEETTGVTDVAEEPTVNSEGNPIVKDDAGNILKTDENGLLVLDEEGNPIILEEATVVTPPPVVEEVVEENTDIPTTELDFVDTATGETNHYYMGSGGQIYVTGKSTTTRYSFYLPVEYKYYYDTDGTVMYAGYVLTSDMNLYSLVEENQIEFDEIAIHPAYAFNEDLRVDENTLHDIQIRVDKTLDALYGYKNTEAEYKLYYKFNTYDASYNGITSMQSYSEPNELGYNTRVEYTITTPQGFTYTLETYMLVEPDGNSWVIKKIM